MARSRGRDVSCAGERFKSKLSKTFQRMEQYDRLPILWLVVKIIEMPLISMLSNFHSRGATKIVGVMPYRLAKPPTPGEFRARIGTTLVILAGQPCADDATTCCEIWSRDCGYGFPPARERHTCA